jgi:hypothetical protein
VFESLSQEIRHPALLDVLKALHERGASLLTTNYDDALENHYGLQRISRSNQDDVSRFQRGDLNGDFHIHRSYYDQHEVVLDTTDYYEVKHSNQVQDVLKPFLQYKTILKETVLRKDHPDTLTTMNNLAISLDSRASTQRPRLYIKGRM